MHKILGYYIFIPAVIIYAAIFYIYFGKMLYLSSLLKSLISYIVVFYVICGFISHVLIYPEYVNSKKSWISRYIKLFYLSLIPLLVLYFYAVIIRINDYGIAVNRGFLLLLGVWFILATIYFIVSKSKNIIILPSTLLLLLITSYAGTLSIYNTSMYSQTKRLNGTTDIAE